MVERRTGTTPLVVSFPHSGTALPPAIAARLTAAGRSLIDTDWEVDRLYGFAHALGASTLRANLSRYVVDCNRDPAGASLYPGRRTTGVCPVETFEGEPLYASGDEPDDAEIAARVDAYWKPYHRELEALLAATIARHGYAVLLDAHSIWGTLPLLFAGDLPDVNFGTNGTASCARAMIDAAVACVAGSAYSYVVDGRFRGGFITRAYGAPARRVHALQIELNQRTYLVAGSRTAYDETKAAALGATLEQICATLAAWAPAPDAVTP